MKLGILTAPFPELSLGEVAQWAKGAGFEALEIACWPQAGGETRRYAGTAHLPIEEMTPGLASEIADDIAAQGLAISGLGYYPNPLHADPAHREMVIGHLKKVIRAAQLLAQRRSPWMRVIEQPGADGCGPTVASDAAPLTSIAMVMARSITFWKSLASSRPRTANTSCSTSRPSMVPYCVSTFSATGASTTSWIAS